MGLQTEIFRSFKEEGRKEGKKQGKKEGKQEGKKQQARRMLMRQMRRRFGYVPKGVPKTLRSLSVKQLEELGDLFVDADYLDDFIDSIYQKADKNS